MKKTILIVLTLLVGVALAVVITTKGDGNALQVNQVGADPLAYSGTITVTGIMAGVSTSDPSIFGIYDIKELQCTTANCNKLYIPVRHQGTMPKIGDEVRVTGSFMKVIQGVVFTAEKVKVVRNHQIGG
ncbi:MAG: hypothetical protein CVU69_12145 [Deltaproteobacteria bacterium HGW-Deltaproteobacteria-4]|nr:MAG: hypothetical protein CVU69_12145 [Deltaproteobacteria bacterium HGW-Deltaproteobacteria-4]